MKYEVIVAILCITLLEAILLIKGINGTIFTIVVAAIAALAANQVKAIEWQKLIMNKLEQLFYQN